jgi:hypothetical protein
MLITTHILLSASVPEPHDVVSWLHNEVGSYPVAIKKTADRSYDLTSSSNFLGQGNQTVFDLHAAALLWLFVNHLMPKGVDTQWSNSYVNGGEFSDNTSNLERLASSRYGSMFIVQIRPELQSKFPGRVV